MTTCIPGQSCFENVAITVKSRPLYDVMGNPISPYPLTVGVVIQHWCDLDLASAWFTYANNLLNGPDSAVDPTRHAADSTKAVFIQTVLDAICQGFNALNIVWWNQPAARAIYRKWISGPPMSVAGQWAAFAFGPDQNYGGTYNAGGFGANTSGWFDRSGDAPVVHANPLPGGIIPRHARRIFDQYYWPGVPDAGPRHPTQFIPTIGLTLALAPGFSLPDPAPGSVDARSLQVELANEVQNTFFAMTSLQLGCDPVTAYPSPMLCGLRDARGDLFIDSAGVVHPWIDNSLYNDATDFRFARAYGEIAQALQLPMSPGYMEYVPFLRELVATMVATSPIDLIQDSRAFVVYQNASYVIASHSSLANYLATVFGGVPATYAAWTTPDPALNTVATVAYAVGGAAAPYTYGISAIAGAAIGTAATLANVMTRHPAGTPKDDLGRLKPTYERAWLSGDQDPNDIAASVAPSVVLRVPPGYIRIPFAQDPGVLLAGMGISARDYLALTRAQRFERVGSFLQGGPYVAPTSDPVAASLLGRTVDALDTYTVRVGFAGPPDLQLPAGPPCLGDCYGSEAPPGTFWNQLGVAVVLGWSLWKIFVG